MKFTPRSENDIAADGLMTPGVYGFEIADAVEGKSKASGNDMITLTVRVFDEHGMPNILYDYLLESVAYKLRHAAETCGLLDHYNRGALEAIDFIGKTGRCKIGIEKDKAGQYPDKNRIMDYVPDHGAPLLDRASPRPSNRVKSPAGDIDDEVPF